MLCSLSGDHGDPAYCIPGGVSEHMAFLHIFLLCMSIYLTFRLLTSCRESTERCIGKQVRGVKEMRLFSLLQS